MVISDGTLKEMISSRQIIVEPLTDNSIQSASIDCTLGNHFLKIEDHEMEIISMDTEIKYNEITAEVITIPAHSFILATTNEYIELPNNVTSFVEGRSSIGRMGLFIQNAGWVDPGFKGKITLEMYNANSLPIKIKAGRRICQLVFCFMDKNAINPYTGKYQGQNKTTGSKVFKDIEIAVN